MLLALAAGMGGGGGERALVRPVLLDARAERREELARAAQVAPLAARRCRAPPLLAALVLVLVRPALPLAGACDARAHARSVLQLQVCTRATQVRDRH